MFAEDRPGPSLDNTSRAFMANPSVVFPSGELADNATTSIPSGEGCLDKSSVGNDTSVEFETNVNACKVSGDASLTAKYLQTLPTSSSTPGDQVRKNSTQFTRQSMDPVL